MSYNTRATRAALKRAFPRSKISVTSGSRITVRWTDDGPTVEQVQQALLSTDCAQDVTDRYGDYYGGRRFLESSDGGSFWFDRYNTIERAAEQEQREQEHIEYEARRRREHEAVAAARQAKENLVAPVTWQRPPDVKDPAAFEAFERLRLRAEGELARDVERSRRPTWAPPMILGEELGELCYTLGYITDDETWVGRLWATFATPKRSGQYLRENVSSLPLTGISCRGFQFHPGESRKPTHQIVFEAQRKETGEWQFGPRWHPSRYQGPEVHKWESLVRDRERQRTYVAKYPSDPAYPAQIAELTRRIEAVDAEDLKRAQAHRERQQMRARVLELARARVLDFIGAPDVQMQLAGRLWGHCCICGKELTDPISLERGIGPDCYQAIVDSVRGIANRRQEQGQPFDAQVVAAVTHLPLQFVAEVLNEAHLRV